MIQLSRVALGATVALIGSLAIAAPANADTPTPSAAALAAALVESTPASVTGASFVNTPVGGAAAFLATTPRAGFPREGSSYAVLSSGDASRIVDDSFGEDLAGDPVRGDTDYDVTVFKVDIDVPPGQNCLAGIDFRFLSIEYPEFVGSQFNDAFIFEIDESTWMTDHSTITAPGNFAFDEFGNLISINAAGASTMTASLAAGTSFDGSTRTLTAQAPLTPGSHHLYFSIFDQGDHILDSVVLLDNLRMSSVGDVATGCQPGITAVPSVPVTATAPDFNHATQTTTIPSVPNVIYSIGPIGEPAYPVTGDQTGSGQVAVQAAAIGDYAIEGESAWTHTYPPGGSDEIVAVPPVVASGDPLEVVIPDIEHVTYSLNGEFMAPGSYPIEEFASIDAFADFGYQLEGQIHWDFVGPDAVDTTPVVTVSPVPDYDENEFQAPDVEGVTYSLDGEDLVPGQTYTASGPTTISSYANTSGTALHGPTQWRFVFDVLPTTPVSAEVPTFSDPISGEGTIEIPDTTGVNYKVNGETLVPGSHSVAGQVSILASAEIGFALNDGAIGWSHTYVYAVSHTVTAPAPTMTDLTGTVNDTFTIPNVVGIRYYLDGALLAAGVHSTDGGTSFEITAIPTAGYTLVGTSTFFLNYTTLPSLVKKTNPVISGAVYRVGTVLTATKGGWGTPTPTSYAYAWHRDGTPISGATAASYTPTVADFGHTLTVVVTASRAGYSPTIAESLATPTIARGVLTPAAVPKISGLVKVGSTLTAATGTWAEGTSFSFQWFASGVAISGATEPTLVLAPAQFGKKVTVSVSGQKAEFEATKLSLPTVAVAAAPFDAAPVPTISGTPQVGHELTAEPGTWSPSANFTYQWKANGVAIPSTNAAVFTPKGAQLGKIITVTVTGSQLGYVSQTKTSLATPTVAAGVYSATPEPTVTGTARVGDALTASTAGWDAGSTFTYRWYADGVVIPKATAVTYVPTATQVGEVITVRATSTTPGYPVVVVTSVGSDPVARGSFVTAPTPTVTGLAKVGKVVTAVPGAWAPAATFSYQWYADGVAIPNAEASTFKLTAAEAGLPITVRVIGSRSGYASTPRVSAPTGDVALATFATTPIPKISGTPKVGGLLKAVAGTWSPAATISYQWLAGAVAIPGATAATFSPTVAEQGVKISVQTTGTLAGYDAVTKTSVQTAVVGPS